MPSIDRLEFHHDSFHGRIGIARKDITPPIGAYARNWGAATHDLAESVHRPLSVTALTLTATSGGPPLVYVDADLGWWKSLVTARRFLKRICEAVSVAPANLIFALTHTHSAVPLMESDPAMTGNDLLQKWMEGLVQSTIAAIRESLGSQFDATLDWNAGQCGLASVRDLPDPNPQNKRLVCGFDPAGKPDHTLLVGRITDAQGVIRGTLVNYGCHPTTLAWENKAISPDYIGAMRQTIQAVTGAPALFMIGICGELAPKLQYVKDTAIPDKHGRQLGYAALSTLEGMEQPGHGLSYMYTVESGAPLAVWRPQARASSSTLRSYQSHVELPLKDWPTADELEQQRSVCTDRALQERLRRKRDIRLSLGDGASFGLPIDTWRIGDAVLIGTCCEAYSSVQQELRRRFAPRTIVCMNLINGSIGYLPPAELYDTDVYTVWQTPFDRGSMELTIEAMTQAITHVLAED